MSTDSETLLLDFPNQPLWTNVYVRNKARATVPLLWSRVQVCNDFAAHMLFTQPFFFACLKIFTSFLET